MCLYPKIITNPKYKPNKKNGGEPWKVPCKDERTKYIAVGCGKCIECRRKKVREWLIRLQWEEKTTKINGRTLTLSFSEESLDNLPKEANKAAARAIKLFLKRWDKEKKRTIRHWFIAELGKENTERLHLHGIVWEKDWKDIERIWGYGNVKFGDNYGNTTVNENSIRYMTKYVLKPDEKHKGFIGKIFASKGIGAGFKDSMTAKKYAKLGTEAPQYIKTDKGTKIDIPIYFRNKIFDEDTRENIWIKLLDKQTRYVMGEKIDVSTPKGEKEYYKTLEYYQDKNKRLGYSARPWHRDIYETRRKRLKAQKKIEKKFGIIKK